MNDWVFKYNTSTGTWDSTHYWPESPYPIGTNFTINAYDIIVLRLATNRWINIEGGLPQMVI
ncbi:unnamed protein product [marine sediment metagenome]|uniref:Uncharacterized protein n=1 Tax=marine sediment metagenome TaxID=412755 RepID=X1G3H5_9ZZZZ